MLDGARMVMASEVEEGPDLSRARIKAITGGDSITAGRAAGQFYRIHPVQADDQQQPQAGAEGVDNSTRRRFNVGVPFDKRPAMPVEQKLGPEMAGILRWMVNGCLEWRRNGLGAPER